MEPQARYKNRIFTTNSTGYEGACGRRARGGSASTAGCVSLRRWRSPQPLLSRPPLSTCAGVTHIPRDVSSGKIDFSPVIAAAQASEGFKATKPAKEHLTGFGHKAVLSVAPAVIDAVKAGKISRFVLIGGCDGTEPERAYYTRLATALPDSAVILTLGCAKFKLLVRGVAGSWRRCGRPRYLYRSSPTNQSHRTTPYSPPIPPHYTPQGKNDYGVVPGTSIPRVLDMGQCNDSYSAVVVATELAKAFGCGVNDLPLSIVLSWLEQKARDLRRPVGRRGGLQSRVVCMTRRQAAYRHLPVPCPRHLPSHAPQAVAVLLSTLHLGLKGIRIGPSLPAFVTPNVLALLQREFDLKPVNNDAADGDVDAVMGKIKA